MPKQPKQIEKLALGVSVTIAVTARGRRVDAHLPAAKISIVAE